MNSLKDVFILNNGVEIPCIGYGTWRSPNDDTTIQAVKHAILSGYRHIDTAAVYKNEEAVGQGIRESGIPRDELFITTKVWNDDRGYEATKEAFEVSLKKLGLSYVDLYLIHWPNPMKFRGNWEAMNAETYRAMEDLVKEGKIKAIGVSNFMIHHLEALLKSATIVPAVNQIKLCPGILQEEIVAYCKDKDIVIEAYSPLGTGKAFNSTELLALADKYEKSVAQICIRYCLQKGYLPLPKSMTFNRIEENAEVFDFEISEEDLRLLDCLEGMGEAPNPDTKEF